MDGNKHVSNHLDCLNLGSAMEGNKHHVQSNHLDCLNLGSAMDGNKHVSNHLDCLNLGSAMEGNKHHVQSNHLDLTVTLGVNHGLAKSTVFNPTI